MGKPPQGGSHYGSTRGLKNKTLLAAAERVVRILEHVENLQSELLTVKAELGLDFEERE